MSERLVMFSSATPGGSARPRRRCRSPSTAQQKAGSMTNADVTAVIFDYGGVLTSPIGDSIREWIDADGVSPESFHRTLEAWLSRNAPVDSPVHRLERGEITADGFADLLAAELVRTDGSPVDAAGLLDRIFAGVEPDEAMYILVDDVRALGIKVGLLSNSWG